MRLNAHCCLDRVTNIKNLQSNIYEQYFYETLERERERERRGRGGEEEEVEREVEIVSFEII